MLRKTIFLCGLALLVGCSGGSATPLSFTEALALARSQWAAQGLRSYRFTVQKGCFCPEEYTRPVTITVRDGVAVDAPEHLAAYSNVEKVLDVLAAADASKADQLDVNFTTAGWPQRIYVDQNKSMADEEYTLTLSDLTPI
jgi:hypothetical protein